MVGKPKICITIEREETSNSFDIPAKFGASLVDALRKDEAVRQAVNDGLYHGYTITIRHYIDNEAKS